MYRNSLLALKSFAKAYCRRLNTTAAIKPFNYYVLNESPLVIYSTIVSSITNIFIMSQQIADRRAHFVVGFSWAMDAPAKALFLRREWRHHQRIYPNHSIVFLGNSTAECDIMERLGLPFIFVNKNAFLDFNVYHPLPDAEKHFAAVLNSRMAPFKRLELAQGVTSLVVITRPHPGQAEYAQRIRSLLSYAHWPNYDTSDNYQALAAADVNRYVNQSSCGLILSRTEGQCQASAEYLLCGVPVVSTESTGGRDTFFSDDYVKIVPPSPQAVRNGVEEMLRESPSPEHIREQTLKRVEEHRQRFCDYLNEIVADAGAAQKHPSDWFSRWKNKLKHFGTPAEFAKLAESSFHRVNGAGMGARPQCFCENLLPKQY